MKKKKYFRVHVTMSSYLFIDVEADSAEDARDIAVNVDGGAFIEDGMGSWDLGKALPRIL